MADDNNDVRNQSGSERAFPEPCSGEGSLVILGKIELEEFTLPAGSKGKIYKASVDNAGIAVNVDYVNHITTLAESPNKWVIRVGDGIISTPTADGLKFELADKRTPGLNIVPVADPSTQQIGLFLSHAPPQNDTRDLKAHRIVKP